MPSQHTVVFTLVHESGSAAETDFLDTGSATLTANALASAVKLMARCTRGQRIASIVNAAPSSGRIVGNGAKRFMADRLVGTGRRHR